MKTGKNSLTPDQNIYLIGFMGAGKSTVGKILAKKLNREFFDTDFIIEKKIGTSISQIFLLKGESFFRNIESTVVKEVAKNTGAVIALGGGAILSQANWEIIKNSGITIYLKWDIQLLLPRILTDKTRPLVNNTLNNSGRTEIEEMLVQREPFYKRADVILECKKYTKPSHIADQILIAIQEG
ncbi:MAG: shikimate kinase [bacterium]